MMNPDKIATPTRPRLSGDFPTPRTAPGPCNHMVQFYASDAYLVETVTAFLEAGFQNGEAVILAITPGHREAFEREFARSGTPTPDLLSDGRLVLMDAETALDRILVDGWPDEAKFQETMGGAISRGLRAGRGVRVFGEMVALLWARGLDAAALRLEELWNELGRAYTFSLFCA